MFLKYLDKTATDTKIEKAFNNKKKETENNEKQEIRNKIYFRSDAIKTAKDVGSTLQKIFAAYQKI